MQRYKIETVSSRFTFFSYLADVNRGGERRAGSDKELIPDCEVMKKIVCTWFVLVICSAVLFAENGILERLQQIPQVSDIKKWEVSPFLEYYEFRFEQPVDHELRNISYHYSIAIFPCQSDSKICSVLSNSRII